MYNFTMPTPSPIPPQLKQVPIYQGLTDQALAEVIHQSRTRCVKKDGFFFMQGDSADRLYVLIEGRAKLCQMTADGQQVILKIVGPWQMFGGLALVGGEEYPVCALAAEDSRALTWSTAVLTDLLHRYPLLSLNATRWMSSHVKETQQLFTQLATERVEQRVARTLLRLTAQMGMKRPDGVLLDFALTRQDLAEMSGTTLYTVSRILSQWKKDGLIETGRERVLVKYPHGLLMIAEDGVSQA
jgi:CRP-like cAMP-binding protein